MTEKRAAPWRGVKRTDDPRTVWVNARCTQAERTAIAAAAAKAGLDIGGLIRTLANGSPGPRSRRRPPVERVELARLLGLVGNMAGNVNQLAYTANAEGELPVLAELQAIRAELVALRPPLMRALGRPDGD